MLRQRVRPEVAGPMTSSGGASSKPGTMEQTQIYCEYSITRAEQQAGDDEPKL